MNYESRKTIEKNEEEINPETEPKTEELDSHTLSFIRGGHIDIPDMANFNPANMLSEIRKTPLFARPDLYKKFKARIKRFRESVADAQLSMEGLLRSNPDASSEELYRELNLILENHSLKFLNQVFYDALETYLASHQAIQKIVDIIKKNHKDQWQEAFFDILFGQLPKGKVEVEVMPMTILFKIHNSEDFGLASIDSDKKEKEEELLSSTVACLCNSGLPIPVLNEKVILVNVSAEDYNPDLQEAFQIHEEEHAIHNNLYPTSAMVRRESGLNYLSLTREAGVDEFIKALKNFSRFYTASWKFYAKSEILAYWKGQQKSSRDIFEELLGEETLYNYLNDYGEEDAFVKKIFEHIEMVDLRVKDNNNDFLDDESIKKIVLEVIRNAWSSYKKDLAKALNEVFQLEEKYGNSTEARLNILRLLSQEPIDKWHRLVKEVTSTSNVAGKLS
ncbi:MAG: hypothetical protein HYT63_02965 [Candidatus Yanofskybacteria bacterium]|nr:hypothetical protein [Candidatus Yanofskybacteria bacterium]